MELTEKAKIFYRVWACAHRRRYMYRGTPREQREHETILMCLNIAKLHTFDTDKPKHL